MIAYSLDHDSKWLIWLFTRETHYACDNNARFWRKYIFNLTDCNMLITMFVVCLYIHHRWAE